ncbi:MAG: hypothetical protein ABW223_09050 [Rariglobus sp.]
MGSIAGVRGVTGGVATGRVLGRGGVEGDACGRTTGGATGVTGCGRLEASGGVVGSTRGSERSGGATGVNLTGESEDVLVRFPCAGGDAGCATKPSGGISITNGGSTGRTMSQNINPATAA